MTGPVRIAVDGELCIASGQCVLVAPDIFDQDDDGIAIVIDPDPAPGRQADLEDAANRCPARAIVIS
ncbi:ferredoxin [Jatrophihabitans sp.]|uniref:ferredoxin n=1 Tax=Jatrophihabitans sp. TaxID=1932789 RepID=UPI0030C66834|nr:ferredoxin [Jatrophihabitans sp.]